jgi:hypothetical protein
MATVSLTMNVYLWWQCNCWALLWCSGRPFVAKHLHSCFVVQ